MQSVSRCLQSPPTNQSTASYIVLLREVCPWLKERARQRGCCGGLLVPGQRLVFKIHLAASFALRSVGVYRQSGARPYQGEVNENRWDPARARRTCNSIPSYWINARLRMLSDACIKNDFCRRALRFVARWVTAAVCSWMTFKNMTLRSLISVCLSLCHQSASVRRLFLYNSLQRVEFSFTCINHLLFVHVVNVLYN